MSESDLKLSCGGFPPWSARGCTQVLQPIPTGELRRTVNGQLVYTGLKNCQKYQSLIQCQDKSAIALDGVWTGHEVEVSCIQRLSQKVSGQIGLLDRAPVPGTVRAVDEDGNPIRIEDVEDTRIRFAAPARSAFISYCPLLRMRVVDFGYDTDEWGLKSGWRLKLEEI